MTRETRQIGRFTATDDGGNQYTLVVYQDFLQSPAFGGGVSETPGLPRLCTEEGEHVNRLSKGEYELVASALRLHSNDPKAI